MYRCHNWLYTSEMPKVVCPHCDSPAASVSLTSGRKYYCVRCGWNAEIARAELRTSINIAAGIAALGLILAGISRLRNPGEWVSPMMLILAFSGLPVFWAVRGWRQLHRLSPTTPVEGVNRVSDASGRATFSDKKTYPELLQLARPRKPKIGWRGRFYFAIVIGSLWTFWGLPQIWNEFRTGRVSNEWMLFLWSAMIY